MPLVADRLRFVRAVGATLRESGWVKGAFEDDEGCVCILGAGVRVLRRRRHPDADGPVWDRVAHALGFESGAAAVAWNDAAERTLDDVLLRLDAFAYELAHEEAAALGRAPVHG